MQGEAGTGTREGSAADAAKYSFMDKEILIRLLVNLSRRFSQQETQFAEASQKLTAATRDLDEQRNAFHLLQREADQRTDDLARRVKDLEKERDTLAHDLQTLKSTSAEARVELKKSADGLRDATSALERQIASLQDELAKAKPITPTTIISPRGAASLASASGAAPRAPCT